MAAAAIACLLGLPVSGSAQQFVMGDVFVSGTIPLPGVQASEAKLLQYDGQGHLKAVLADIGGYSQFGRLAFSPNGTLYTTSNGIIVSVSPAGQVTEGPYLRSFGFYYSLSFAADGSLLAGAVAGVSTLSEFASSGTRLHFYQFQDDVYSIDLAADQCTACWLGGGGIRRFNVCQGIEMSKLINVNGSDFRLLPSGGVAITRFNTLEIYSASGSLVRTIPNAGGVIALDVDGTSIWSSYSGSLSKVDIATGTLLLGPIQTGLNGNDGLTVYGEPRAALINGPLAAIPTLSSWLLLILFAGLAGVGTLRLRG